MADETNTQTQAPPTIESLQALMKAAVAENKWQDATKIAAQLAKMQTEALKKERDAKQEALKDFTGKVKAIFDKVVAILCTGEAATDTDLDALTALFDEIDSEGLVKLADGFWYSRDFGDANLSAMRLMKNEPRAGGKAKTGGEGEAPKKTGKNFDISSEELLKLYGSEKMSDKEDAPTFQEAYDSDTDKNKRYQVRKALLKRHGLAT